MDGPARQHLALGREHYGRHEYASAEFHLLEVLKYSRGFADVHNMLGVIHHDRGEFTEARACFECALQVNRNYTEAALNLAVTYNDLGMYTEARRIYAEVALTADGGRRLDPYARGKIANLHADVARAYEDLELYSDAAMEYRRALSLCPDFGDLRTRLGAVLRAAGDMTGATREFMETVRRNPGYAPAWVSLGVTEFALGHREDARQAWEGALAQEPDNKPAQLYLRMLDSTEVSLPPAETLAGDLTGEFQLSLLTDREPSSPEGNS